MSDLTPGCEYCADGQRDGFGGDNRCGYCGRFYDTPDEQHHRTATSRCRRGSFR